MVTIKLPRVNPWIISTLILLLLSVFLFVQILQAPLQPQVTGMAALTSEEAAQKAIDYINDNLVQTGQASFISVEEFSGMYKVTTSYQGQQIDVYITSDGSYLFVAQPFDTSKELPKQEEQPTQQPTVVEASVDDDPFKGSNDAPLTMIEFSDFQCPFCGRFFRQTLPQIEESYIKTGKVKYVFRDFPLGFHQHAQKAAEAAECADEQGKFWEYHDKLFENQQALDIASLKQYAEDLGLDSTAFDNCLDSGDMASEVQKDIEDGQSYGVTGTPAFFINGQKVSGAQPFSVFQQIIDAKLG